MVYYDLQSFANDIWYYNGKCELLAQQLVS